MPGMTSSSSLELAEDGHRADQALGVRVERLAEQGPHVGLLDDLARVHHRDPVAHLGDDAEVVGDEDDGRARLALEAPHQVQDLRLDGHVEGGRRLVCDQQLRLAGKRHRDHHALRHAARHLVRVSIEPALRVGDADHPHQLERPFPAAFRFMPRWISSTSPIWSPTFMTGFSEDVGCWKIIEIRSPRISRISSSVSLSRSLPSKITSPSSTTPGGATRRMIESEVTLLPQPDSPTRPRISPRRTAKSTPVTALTVPSGQVERRSRPPHVEQRFAERALRA